MKIVWERISVDRKHWIEIVFLLCFSSLRVHTRTFSIFKANRPKKRCCWWDVCESIVVGVGVDANISILFERKSMDQLSGYFIAFVLVILLHSIETQSRTAQVHCVDESKASQPKSNIVSFRSSIYWLSIIIFFFSSLASHECLVKEMSRCYIERYADMNVSMYSEQTHTHAGGRVHLNIENMTERTKRIFFIYMRNMLMLKLMRVCVSESMECLHWIDKNVDQYFGFLINVFAANKRKSCRLSSSSQHHNQPTNEIIITLNELMNYYYFFMKIYNEFSNWYTHYKRTNTWRNIELNNSFVRMEQKRKSSQIRKYKLQTFTVTL